MENNRPPMKWHCFLIYFSLWSLALSAALEAFDTFSFRGMNSEIYGVSENLYIAIGVIYSLLAAFTVITRFALARYRRRAPAMLCAVYSVQSALLFAAYCLERASSGTDIDITQTATSISALLAILIANIIYYRKRAHLFVN